MTNRPEYVEDENHERVEAQKDRLPDFEQVNRPRQDHPMDRDQEVPAEESGRMNETGAGRGWDHQGH